MMVLGNTRRELEEIPMERVNRMRALDWSVLWGNPKSSVLFDLLSAAAASVCFRPIRIPPPSPRVLSNFLIAILVCMWATPPFSRVRVTLRADCLASLAVNSAEYRLTPYRMSIYISIPSVYPSNCPTCPLLRSICRAMLISDIILTAKQIQLCPTPL